MIQILPEFLIRPENPLNDAFKDHTPVIQRAELYANDAIAG